MKSYDCKQREAVMVRCVRCSGWKFYTVVAKFICGGCR
jgi:hypothetical protein